MTGMSPRLGKLPNSRTCIICGRENPIGLKLQFNSDGEQVWTEVTPGTNFEGFEGVLHGGIIASLLDDALWYACFSRGCFTFTVELAVRFRKVIHPESRIRVQGRFVGNKGRLMLAEGEILDSNGEVLASAEGKFMVVPPEEAERLADFMVP